MNRHLAALLICLGCHTGATYACDDPAHAVKPPAPTASASAGRLIATANAAEATPMVRRAATHADVTPRFASTLVAMPDAPAPKRESDTDRDGDHSDTLWIVGLVLIAGIALRRWGFERA